MTPGSADSDRGTGPLRRFAEDLQNLRLRAGSPDYRTMARRAGCAPSTLATADNGRKLPTLRTTVAYVRACGVDESEQEAWIRRWHELKAQPDQTDQPAAAVGATPEPAPESDDDRSGPTRERRRRRAWLAAAGVGVVVIAGAVIVNLVRTGGTPSSVPPASPAALSSTSAASESAPAPVRRQGTLVLTPGEVADLDSMAANWDAQPGPGPATVDIWFDDQDHALHGVGNNDIAVLPPGSATGFWPCALEQDYGVTMAGPDIAPGRVLCGLTAANRVAQLRITNVTHDALGQPDQITFAVTVWVPPHKT